MREFEARLDEARREIAVQTWEHEQLRLFAQLAPRWFDVFREAPLAQKKQMVRAIPLLTPASSVAPLGAGY